MGKIILIIACALLVLTIAAGFLLPKMSDIIGPISDSRYHRFGDRRTDDRKRDQATAFLISSHPLNIILVWKHATLFTMYKWDATDYQKNSEVQLTWGKELIAKLDLHGNEHILDIGCGDGKVTAEIAAHVPDGKVVGIDSSSDMIDLACTTFPVTNFPNLSLFSNGCQGTHVFK